MPRKKPAPARTSTVRIFTVPAHASFADSIAAGMIATAQGDALALADQIIVLPDEAMAKAVRRAVLSQMGDTTGFLPRIESLDRLTPEAIALQVASRPDLAKSIFDLPPAISMRERQMVLARAIMDVPGLSPSVPAAMKLARGIGRLIDQIAEYNVDLSRLDTLADPRFGVQWQKTRDVLRIVTETWPAYLRTHNRMDSAARRHHALGVLAAYWQAQPPAGSVIAAGFRSSTPAHSALVHAVAAMPKGSVVVQGFDPAMDDAIWNAMDDTHPDYPVRRLADALGFERSHIQLWPEVRGRTSRQRALPAEQVAARATVMREALRPATTTESWQGLTLSPAATNGLEMITAATPQEEASVLALKLREVLETPGKTAMLVTADRSLARRVAARMSQWGVSVSDAAGSNLAETTLGLYLTATAQMASEEWAPVPFLQALKHPLAVIGRAPDALRTQIAELEDLALRGPRPAPGARGLRKSIRAAFARAAARNPVPGEPDPEAAQREKALLRLVSDITRGGPDFFKLMARKRPQSFAVLLDAHLRACEALAAGPDSDGASRLWRGKAGARAASLLATLRKHAPHMPDMTGREYAATLDTLLREVKVSAPAKETSHPALRIVTPQQALSLKADVVIAGGLTADSWPYRARMAPWLTPQMAAELGLPSGNAGLSDAAHRFMQVLSAPNVLLTRALRSNDAPVVASPLLTRLLMVAQAAGLREEIEGATTLLDIHTALVTPSSVTPIEPPAPTPSKELRPRRLPVSAVEGLMRDPYSVYARYILRLRAKQPLDAAPTAADRGIATHAALDTFMRTYPQDLPEQPYEELLKIGQRAFAAHLDSPTVQAFWWPRFERVAAWFVSFENARRGLCRTLGTEVRGKLDIDLGDSIFTLTAVADRVDAGPDDALAIVDYKTGTIPTKTSVEQGFSPQLTLEALIAINGGFDGIDAAEVGALQYWKLSGGRPAGDVVDINQDVARLVEEAREGVTRLMQAFSNPETPFLVAPRADLAPRFSPYDHLGRAAEWAVVTKTAAKRPANRTRATRPAPKARAPRPSKK